MERCAWEFPSLYWYEIRRLVVPIFLHGGLMHIAFNLYFQFGQGTVSEVEFGRQRFFWLFIVAGVRRCSWFMFQLNYIHFT